MNSRATLIRKAALFLVFILAPSSHRIPSGSLVSLLPDGSIPRPSRRAQPESRALGQRPTPKAQRDARDPWTHRLALQRARTPGLTPKRSDWSAQWAISQETKPEYLKFFRTPHLQDYRSPPA